MAVEGQLCATPVVAFDSGGLPDVVAHDRTGVLVPAGNVLALAAALDALLADPARGARLGAAGRVAALERFTPRAVAERYAGIYRDASASGASPARPMRSSGATRAQHDA